MRRIQEFKCGPACQEALSQDLGYEWGSDWQRTPPFSKGSFHLPVSPIPWGTPDVGVASWSHRHIRNVISILRKSILASGDSLHREAPEKISRDPPRTHLCCVHYRMKRRSQAAGIGLRATLKRANEQDSKDGTEDRNNARSRMIR